MRQYFSNVHILLFYLINKKEEYNKDVYIFRKTSALVAISQVLVILVFCRNRLLARLMSNGSQL